VCTFLEDGGSISVPEADFFLRIGFLPDSTQERILKSRAKRGILNCCRQWGKSTVAAAKAVERAYRTPRSLILVASPGERQSSLLVGKAREFVRALGLRARGDAASVVLPNGSEIVGLPGTEATTRGYSAVSLLIFDEASRVLDEQYKALLPTLAVSDGDLWLLSTPYGKRGFFYEAWEHGGPEWERVTVAATECNRISKGFLETARRDMGSAWFAQEYLCSFVDNEGSVFGRDVVERALDDAVEPLVI